MLQTCFLGIMHQYGFELLRTDESVKLRSWLFTVIAAQFMPMDIVARNFISFNYTDIICAVLVYFKIFHAILALVCFGLMSTIMDDLSWSIVLTCSMQISVLARFAIHWDVRKHGVHLHGLVLVVGEY